MISIHDSIAELLAHNPNFGSVIQRFEIRADQNYKLPLKEALHGMDESFVLSILHLFESDKPYPKDDFDNISIQSILIYLQKTHQYYLEKKLPELENSILSICNEEEPESILRALLASFYKDFKHDLCKHISLEERELFPYIKQILNGETPQHNVIDSFTNHHDDHSEQQLLELVRVLHTIYPDTHSMTPVAVLKTQLAGFEKDLEIHAFFEDELLIPKVLAQFK